MNLLLRSTLLFVLLPALASAEETYRRFENGKHLEQKIIELEGTRVSPDCAQAAKRCAALQAHLKKPDIKVRQPKGLAGHPANAFCVAIGGNPVLLLDAEKNQRNFCELEDRSLIDSWQLLRKARGRK